MTSESTREKRQCIPDFGRFLEGGQNARKKVRVETFLKRGRKGVLRHKSKMQSSGGVGGGPVASAPSTIGLKTSAHAVVQCLKGKIKQHIQRADVRRLVKAILKPSYSEPH